MKKIKDNLPIATAYLLIIGITRMLVYYEYFGIDIFSFLDFSEIIQLQYEFYATAIALLIIVGVWNVFDYDENKLNKNTNSILVQRVIPSSKIKISMLVFTIIFFGLIIAACIADAFGRLKLETILLFLTFPSFAFACLSTYVIFVWGHNRNNESITKHSSLIFIGVAAIGSIYMVAILARNQAIKIVDDGSNQNVYLVTEKTNIATTSNIIYIGKTKNYLFFYNKKKRLAEVIKYEDVKELSFEKKGFQ